jgi:hypothetical protein
MAKQGDLTTANDCQNTAGAVHAHSYSIVAVVAGLIAAIAIFAVLLFVFYDGQSNIGTIHTQQVDAMKNSSAAR